MATVILEIPPGLEKKLGIRAAAEGRDLASLALDLIEKGLSQESRKLDAREWTHEQRLHELNAWVKSLPPVDVVLDVSREGIYEGRGE